MLLLYMYEERTQIIQSYDLEKDLCYTRMKFLNSGWILTKVIPYFDPTEDDNLEAFKFPQTIELRTLKCHFIRRKSGYYMRGVGDIIIYTELPSIKERPKVSEQISHRRVDEIFAEEKESQSFFARLFGKSKNKQ